MIADLPVELPRGQDHRPLRPALPHFFSRAPPLHPFRFEDCASDRMISSTLVFIGL